MAAAGVPLRTLQEWMGHKDIHTTMRYADYAPGTREAEQIANAFNQLQGNNIVAIPRDPTASEGPERPETHAFPQDRLRFPYPASRK